MTPPSAPIKRRLRRRFLSLARAARPLSLRVHLLASYVLLLVTALSVIGVTLMIGLIVQPAPPQPAYQRFAALIRGWDIGTLADEARPGIRGLNQSRIEAVLSDFAASRNTRMLWLIRARQQTYVIYDSAALFPDQAALMLTPDPYINAPLQQTLIPRFHQAYGSFRNADGTEWLYGGFQLDFERQQGAELLFVMSEPRSTVSLQEALNDFSTALLPPLLQAGCVGLGVALLLAILITRTLARPLQGLAHGAAAVAAGDYEHRVAESGPQEIQAVAGAFNEMGRQVRESQQAQRDFLANVSHDLKTPLTSIQGYAQAIIDGAAKDPRAAARIIYDESARLNRLVLEITDLMRMHSGRFSLHMQSLDISTIAAAIAQRLEVVAQQKGVRIVLETPRLPPITGDGDRLAQVLTNLISNAIQFTPPGGTVRVETALGPDSIQIRVQDTGIGIAAEDLPRIFERFYQADKARGPQRGTGLGLAIAREIVEAHGGHITAHSAGANQGAAFTVWLPTPHLPTLVTPRRRKET